MAEFAPLLKAARPTVYQANGFRLIGVAVDAEASEINRQIQKIELMQKFGGTGQQVSMAVLPPPSPPSTAALQDAKQRLIDPQSRLIEEFFWFWPEQPRGWKRDLAIQALQRADSQSAIDIWTARAKKSTDTCSVHNLAIILHCQALDSVNAGNDGNVPEALWVRAWKYWRTLADHDPFWQRLAARIEELDDPRLSSRTASQIRSSVCSAILQIDVSLAIAAAEAGQFSKAGSHLKIARESGFSSDAMGRHVEHALLHVRTRVETMCAEADRKCTEQVEQIPSILRSLAAECKSHLEILNYLVGAGNRLRDAAHDQVAKVIRENLVFYGNKTENWKVCEQLLSIAEPLAVSESQKTQIAEDIATLKRLTEAVTCWFCKENKGEEKFAAIVEMYGDVTRTPAWNGTQFQWRNLPIKIPRCRQCRNLHRMRKVIVALAAGLIATFVAWDSNEPYVPAFFATIAAWIGAFVATQIGWFGRSRTQDGRRFSVLKERAKRLHPIIAEMKARLWGFGRRPSDAPTQLSGATVGKFFAWFGVFLLLTWLFSLFSDSGSAATTQRSATPSRTQTRVETSPPGGVNNQVRAGTNRTGAPRDIFDTLTSNQRDTLEREIQSNKARLEVLSADFQSCQTTIDQYKASIDSDRQQLDQMQSNARIGLDVNQSEYDSIRQRHNSTVRLYNAELARCRSLADEHDTLVETTNAKIREYNRLAGVR